MSDRALLQCSLIVNIQSVRDPTDLNETDAGVSKLKTKIERNKPVLSPLDSLLICCHRDPSLSPEIKI